MGLGKLKSYLGFIKHLIVEYKMRLSERYYIYKHYAASGTFLFGNNHIQNSSIGKYTYVAYNSIIFHANIGRYCSIGPNVVIGFGDHKMDSISTHPSVFLNPKFEKGEINIRQEQAFKTVIIKNDVWIGANVYIKNGVTIGNGAVIGSGSVVTKDVQDYAIVAGVPAKLIRMRFDNDTIQDLIKSEWWDNDPDSTFNMRPEFPNLK